MNTLQTKIQPESIPHLLDQNPSEAIAKLTPAEAQQMWQSEVSAIQRRDGCDYSTAFQRAKILNKQLADKIFTKSGKPGLPTGSIVDPYVAIANSGASTTGDAKIPIPSPGAKKFLGLPTDADKNEFEAAWKANHGLTQPRNNLAIWNALKNLWVGRHSAGAQFNMAAAQFKADAEMASRYPDLARSVGLQQSANQ